MPASGSAGRKPASLGRAFTFALLPLVALGGCAAPQEEADPGPRNAWSWRLDECDLPSTDRDRRPPSVVASTPQGLARISGGGPHPYLLTDQAPLHAARMYGNY